MALLKSLYSGIYHARSTSSTSQPIDAQKPENYKALSASWFTAFFVELGKDVQTRS